MVELKVSQNISQIIRIGFQSDINPS